MDKFSSPGFRHMYHIKQMAGPTRYQDLGFPASSQSLLQQATIFSMVHRTAPGELGEDNQSEVYTKSPRRQDPYPKISDSAPPEELLGQCACSYFGNSTWPERSSGANAPLRPKRGQPLRSQEIILGPPSEIRVRAATSAVQDLWCRPPYTSHT